jgi:2-iminoacetate synthase ThiH
MTLDEILKLIREAGKVPAERDSFYRILQTFDGGPSDARPPTAEV